MDTELRESIDKFRKLTELAHSCFKTPKGINTEQEKITNQLFLKICLSLDSINQILPRIDQEFVLFNLSSLWIFARVLMEEQITFTYLFDESLTAEERDFRFALYLYNGIYEDYELLKTASTENFNNNESLKTIREEEFEKCKKEIERCKEDLAAKPFIKKIPKDNNHYKINEILAGKYPKYIKPDKLIVDQYSNGPSIIFLKWVQLLIFHDNQSIGYPQAYAAYKLGSSFIHSSSFALHKLFIFEQNLKEQNYDDFKIVIKLIRMYTGTSIRLYTEIFNISISEKDLGDTAPI